MNPREDLEAALAKAQARLDAATLGPWRNAIADTGDSVVVGPLALVTGPVESEDAALIVSLRNREQRAIDHATDVLARHGERPLGYIGICARCREPEPCPEIASLHTLWVVP